MFVQTPSEQISGISLSACSPRVCVCVCVCVCVWTPGRRSAEISLSACSPRVCVCVCVWERVQGALDFNHTALTFACTNLASTRPSRVNPRLKADREEDLCIMH